MKALAVLTSLLCAASLHAAVVEIEWDDPDNPAGVAVAYPVELKTGAGQFIKVAAPAATTHTFPNLAPGTYSVRVRAATAEGLESEPSNVITFTVPAAPGQLRIKVAVQASADGERWNDVAVNFIPLDAVAQ